MSSACVPSILPLSSLLLVCAPPPSLTVAAHAGLRAGDVILNINGESVSSHSRACELFNEATKARTTLEIEYYSSKAMAARHELSKPASHSTLRFVRSALATAL